ncbi:MAG: MFS transporter [Bacillota bacterium]|nr:MFS transporter [Bacillota bacterium]MDP4159983.1 MFS transporter [Bacillota bacterium]
MYKAKLWTKDFLIISIENFFVYFIYYLLIATITVYATEKFQASPSIAGLSSGIFILGALLGRFYSGASIERIGRKKMLYMGFSFYLITTLLYFAAYSLQLLLLIRIMHGAAFGMTSTATGTIAAEIIPKERRGEGTGYYALSMTLAAAIGPFLGMFIAQHVNFKINFVICAFVLALSFILSFPLEVSKPELTRQESERTREFKFVNFFEAKAIPISIITALVCFSYSTILSFLASYSKEIQLADAASFFFIVYAVAILVSRPFIGRWFDKKGENFVIYPTFLMFTIALLILSQAHQGLSILVAGALVGLGYGNFFSSAQALAIKVSPKHRMALATSTFFIFADLGCGIGPFLLGFVIPLIGFRGLYLAMGFVVLVNIFLYYFLHGKSIDENVNLAA